MSNPTLRELTGMTPNPSPISESALVLIDCQQTYREGIMQLVGVEPALKEAASLLKRFRAAGRPVIISRTMRGLARPTTSKRQSAKSPILWRRSKARR
jgi:nicotinamidase-related amidase